MCRKRNLITYQGETKSVGEWARSLSIPRQTIYQRLAAGQPVDRVLSPKHLPVGRPHIMPKRRTEQSSLLSDALATLHEDMKAQHRTLHRTIRAFVRTIEDQAASQRLTLERMLEERTRLPADVGPGVVFNFDEVLSDRLSSTAQDRG